MQFQGNRLISMLFAETIVLCPIASFRLISIESTITLLIFNLLFITLAFQLQGPINKKLGLLSLGNIFGLCWSFIFCSLSTAGTSIFGEEFTVLYAIFYPFLNVIWVVPFWSVGLAVLTFPVNRSAEVKS